MVSNKGNSEQKIAPGRPFNWASDDKFSDWEHVTVSKGGNALHTYYAEEIKDWKKTQLQERLGEDFGSGKFYLSVKKKGIFKAQGFQINSIVKDPIKLQEQNKVNSLEDKFDKILSLVNGSSNNANLEQILKLQEDKFEFQIKTMQQTIDKQNTLIEAFQSQLKDSDNADGSINPSGLLELFNNITKLVVPGTNAMSDKSIDSKSKAQIVDVMVSQLGIPERLLQIFGAVDYPQVKPEKLDMLIEWLEQYVKTNLPLKKG